MVNRVFRIFNRYLFSIVFHFMLIIDALIKKDITFYKYFLILATVSYSSLNFLIFNVKIFDFKKLKDIVFISFFYFLVFNIVLFVLFLGKYINSELLKELWLITILLFFIRFYEFIFEVFQQVFISKKVDILKFSKIMFINAIIAFGLIVLQIIFDFNISIVLFAVFLTLSVSNFKILSFLLKKPFYSLAVTFKELNVVFINNVLQRSFQAVARSFISFFTNIDFFFYFNILLYALLPVSFFVNNLKYKILKNKHLLKKYIKFLLVVFLGYSIIATLGLALYFPEFKSFVYYNTFVFLFLSTLFSIIWLIEQTILPYEAIKKLMKARMMFFGVFVAVIFLAKFLGFHPFISMSLGYFVFICGIIYFMLPYIKKNLIN